MNPRHCMVYAEPRIRIQGFINQKLQNKFTLNTKSELLKKRDIIKFS